MLELNKSEYQILYYFYEFNQPLTKHELLERIPDLNKNTAAVVIKRLLDKGYLEVGEIKYSNTVLARAYRPCLPFIEFFKDARRTRTESCLSASPSQPLPQSCPAAP